MFSPLWEHDFWLPRLIIFMDLSRENHQVGIKESYHWMGYLQPPNIAIETGIRCTSQPWQPWQPSSLRVPWCQVTISKGTQMKFHVWHPSICKSKNSLNFGVRSMLDWLVVYLPLWKICQWEGLSHILWNIKNVWNHQPAWISKMDQ